MFTQNEEEWKKTDDIESSEYRRRITHEDICHCCDKRRYKSTDYCGGYSDYMTLHPSQLWFRNDLKQRNRQRQCYHNLNRCSRNSQCCRSEAIQNRRKCLDSTSYADQSVKSSANLRTVRVRPKEFVTKLAAAKDSRKFQADNANVTDFTNIPINVNKFRKASDVPYYGPFRARLIKIIPAMISIKTRNYRSVQEYYSSERKYFREIQNNKPEIPKSLASIKTTHDKSSDSRIKPSTYNDNITKRICSEFDEIPLFASTIPEVDDQTNSLSTIPRIDNQMNPCNSSSFAAMIDESELPKKLFEKNSILNENQHEFRHDKSIEASAFKKGCNKNLKSSEKNEIEVVLEKNPEIRENLRGKMQQMAIKEIANFWHGKTFKKNNQPKKNLQKLQPSQFDHNLYDKPNDKVEHDDKGNSRIISQNVDNTSPIDHSNESKFMAEMHQVRENLPKNVKNSELFFDDKTNVSNNGITSIDEENEIAPEQLPSYSQEILTNYSIQPLDDDSYDYRKGAKFETIPASRILHSTGKTENKQAKQNVSLATAITATAIIPPDLEESLVNVPLLIPEEYAKNTSPLNSGQKHETITAEIYIRNPKNLKSTIINISASDKKMRKPCWMIVKSYQSSCNIFDENISNENFINKGIVRIRSDTNLNEKAENSQITNLPKSTKKQPSTITTIPAVKQEESEENQAKTNLIFSDSELQSKMNHDLTIETQRNLK
ncbi:tRNA-cytidine(32) 2-sulfurtransferase [Dirofilaria immitis]